jgi:predicted RNA-binding Zn-ribbon protein involved in translation (DUF1610 family)
MSTTSRFRCPACGTTIFNRRIPRCESCKAALPVELLLNAGQTAFLDAEYEQHEKARIEMARAAAELERKRIRERGDGG